MCEHEWLYFDIKKATCSTCGGWGSINFSSYGAIDSLSMDPNSGSTCPTCNGSGEEEKHCKRECKKCGIIEMLRRSATMPSADF